MITSKDNKLIKLYREIKEKKYSKKYKLCAVETIKVVSELASKGIVQQILVIESSYDLVKNLNVPIEIISDGLCKYLSDATTSDGVLAICKIVDGCNFDYSRCLILDGIQDPSNFGAILRSACAFGFKTIFSLNSVYPYTYKCIRSSMGYVFDSNIIDITFDELVSIKNRENIRVYVADMNGEAIDNLTNIDSNIAVVIGNEGNGVSDKLVSISDKTISIPMDNNVESLNASVSAGIIMYILKRR